MGWFEQRFQDGTGDGGKLWASFVRYALAMVWAVLREIFDGCV